MSNMSYKNLAEYVLRLKGKFNRTTIKQPWLWFQVLGNEKTKRRSDKFHQNEDAWADEW